MTGNGIGLQNIHERVNELNDIQMPIMTGIEAAEKIIAENPDAKLLFLTTFLDDDYIYKALSIGAKGYILKQYFDNILSALKSVYYGQSVFGTDSVAKFTTLALTNENFDYKEFDITKKEQGVILLVAQGLNNKEISAKLHLSEGTVRNYLSNILIKLDLRDPTQLAIWYYQNK